MELKPAHNIDEKERSDDIKITENVEFTDMFLSDSVLAGLHSCGYVKPSPIQLSAVPLGRCGLDLIVQAKSGTGKTLVFSIIALEMICTKAKTTQVLVIAPTREIAVQITQVINSLSSHMPELKAYSFIGGMNVTDDLAKLTCCHIAIGTPGRLLQLVSLGSLSLKNVRLLVLDEADQLLNNQFKESILSLVETLPLNKQVLAMSATYPTDITIFLEKLMRSPNQVRLDKESPALIGVYQFARILPNHSQSHQMHKLKFNELLKVLSAVTFNQCLVFSNSQFRAESISNQLNAAGWPSSFLTGGQVQTDRLEAFFALCSYKCRVLVSTDLSARGLDSEHVNLVVNLDVPSDQATYLHRVGRAGRFGTSGIAISLVSQGDELKTLRAVATVTNVNLKVINEEYNTDINDYDELEKISYLTGEECCEWLEKNKKFQMKKNKKQQNGCEKIESLLLLDDKYRSKMKKFESELLPLHHENGDSKLNGKKSDNLVNLGASLNDCISHSDVYNFSFNEMKEEISKLSVKEDSTVCELRSFPLAKMPPAPTLNQLNSFIADKKRPSKSSKKVSKKTLNSIINGVQLINLESASKHNLVNGDSSKIHEESYEGKAKSLNKCNGLSVTTTNMESEITEKYVSENITVPVSLEVTNLGPSEITKVNTCVSQAPIIDDKHEKIKEKKKNYTQNTGYGAWMPVAENDANVTQHQNNVYSNSSHQNHLYSSSNHQSKYKRKKHVNNHNEHLNSYESSYSNSSHCSMDYSEYSSSSSESDDEDHCYNYYDDPAYYYIKSAQNFSMMMDYVQTVGKMSAYIAQTYNPNEIKPQNTKHKLRKKF